MFSYFSKCFIVLHFKYKSTYFWVNFLCKGKILFFFFFWPMNSWLLQHFFFNFLTFYFVSGYSRLTMLWQFRVNNKVTQPYMYMCPFSPKLPSLPGCHMILSRGPYSTPFPENISFLHQIALAILSEISWVYFCGSFSGSLFCSTGMCYPLPNTWLP